MKSENSKDREAEIALQKLDAVVKGLEAYRDEKDKFENMEEDALRKYANDGNALACNVLAQKLIRRDGYVGDEALALLHRAAEEFNIASASMLGEYYSAKNVGFADREKEIYYRNLSAYGEEKKNDKWIDKIANGRSEEDKAMYRRAEAELMCRLIVESLLQMHTTFRADGILIEIAPFGLGKKEKDILNVSLIFGNGLCIRNGNAEFTGKTEREENVFEYKKRDKKESVPELLNRLKNELLTFFEKVAPKFRLNRIVMKSGNGIDLLYGGGGDTAGVSQEKRFGGADFEKASGKIKLNVTVEEAAAALERKICPYCGGSLTLTDGIYTCFACGEKIRDDALSIEDGTDKENFGIRIREASEGKIAEVLKCTQCGGSVEVGEEGDFCTCSHCGSLYALNKKELSLRQAGVDRAKMNAEKPKDAIVPEIEFFLCPFFDGRVQAVLPRTFELMGAEMKAIKYNRTANPPEFVYTTPDTTVNLCFNVDYTKDVRDEDVPKAEQATRNLLKKMIAAATFADEGKFVNDHHTLAYFNCITPAADQDIYNVFFFFVLEGKLVSGSFNCLSKDRWLWAPVFLLMIESLRFTTRKKA